MLRRPSPSGEPRAPFGSVRLDCGSRSLVASLCGSPVSIPDNTYSVDRQTVDFNLGRVDSQLCFLAQVFVSGSRLLGVKPLRVQTCRGVALFCAFKPRPTSSLSFPAVGLFSNTCDSSVRAELQQRTFCFPVSVAVHWLRLPVARPVAQPAPVKCF